jgi:hypothetical protein
MKDFLEKIHIPIRIAGNTTTGWPVVVSLWFLHQDGILYCATQRKAKIVKYLKNEPRCGFEIAEDRPPYCGIRGKAIARFDESLGLEILEKLLVRYLGNKDNDLAKKLLAKSQSEVAILLEPQQIFTWDFTKRMKNLEKGQDQVKVCP